MFEFAILTIISLIGLVIFMTMVVLEKEPLGFWLSALAISGFLLMSGFVGGMAHLHAEVTKKEIQIEVQHPSINEEYNYCPYCGKEIE